MLTRWAPQKSRCNPFRELEGLQKRLSSIFGRQAMRADGEKEALTVAEWSPLVDIPKMREISAAADGRSASAAPLLINYYRIEFAR